MLAALIDRSLLPFISGKFFFNSLLKRVACGSVSCKIHMGVCSRHLIIAFMFVSNKYATGAGDCGQISADVGIWSCDSKTPVGSRSFGISTIVGD